MAVAVEPSSLPVTPSRDEVRALAREHNLVPVRHTFIDDCETPVAAFLKLRGADPQSPAFLLESAEQGQRVGRYSFIGVRPRAVIRWSLGDDGDPYEIAAREVGRYRQAEVPDLPPFAGGAVGYFGYDLVRNKIDASDFPSRASVEKSVLHAVPSSNLKKIVQSRIS